MRRKKLMAAMARIEGISSQEFHDHYRHPHGTMGMHISTLRQYVQSHQIHTDLLDESQDRFEAVAELWFDGADDLIHFREEPTMSSYLNADEPNFCDLRKTRLFICEEEVVSPMPHTSLVEHDCANGEWSFYNRPLAIKILQFILPEAGPNWCSPHDEQLGHRLGAFHHVRCHPTTPTTIVPSRMNRPPDFIGVRELWWPTLTTFHRSVAADMQTWRELILRPHTFTMLAQAERWK